MKMTCPQSIKFLKLKRRLKLPHWQVVGLLESVWMFAQMNAPRGDIGRLSNEDLAAGIEWDGEPDQLIQVLLDCGFLDECAENRLLVHDWADHLPTYLKGAMAKNNIECAKHVAKQPAKQSAEQPAKHTAKQTQNDPQQPAPSLALPCVALSSVGNPCVGEPTSSNELSDFDRFWKAYPRRVGKGAARKAWPKAVQAVGADRLIQAATNFATAMAGKDPKYVPHPATWLNREQWDDEPEAWHDGGALDIYTLGWPRHLTGGEFQTLFGEWIELRAQMGQPVGPAGAQSILDVCALWPVDICKDAADEAYTRRRPTIDPSFVGGVKQHRDDGFRPEWVMYDADGCLVPYVPSADKAPKQQQRHQLELSDADIPY